MEKFFVVVNFKYLLMVEAATHGGAEFKIMDGIYYGIETCQAFSMSELSTDTFKALAKCCETISYAELQKKAEANEKICTEINKEQETLEIQKQILANLAREMGEAELKYKNAERNISLLEAELITF